MTPDPSTPITDALSTMPRDDASALRTALAAVTAIRTYGDLLAELARDDGGLAAALDAETFQRIGVACGVRATERTKKQK